MDKVRIYRGGIPTAPDVNRLISRFPAAGLTAGTVVSAADISAEIGVQAGSSRYRTVTNVWRRWLEENASIVLKPLRGQGFMVLSDSGKLDSAADKLKSATKMAARAVEITTRVDVSRLSVDDRARLTKIQQRAGLVAAVEAAKRPQELPQF